MNWLAIVALAIFAFVQINEAHRNRSSTAKDKFKPGKGSFLHYLDRLSILNRTRLDEECHKRKFDFTVYYRMVLMRLCTDNLESYQEFCAHLELHKNNQSDDLAAKIDKMAQQREIFGAGLASDERDLALKACGYIADYFSARNETYTEWLVHAAPFALPTACGFSRKLHNELRPSAFDCLALSGQALLYFVFALDALIVACVVIANCVILVVTLRTPSLRTLHGFYRVSLACSDLLIGCVLSASMHTTHCMFLKPRPFLEEGQSQKMTHYHSAAYVNAFGFVTVMSFSTSIFTLVAITVERFRVEIVKKREASASKTRKVAGLSLTVIWTTAFLIALVPVFVPRYRYTVTALSVIIAPNFYIVYLIFLGLSLFLVWVLNLAMCCACAKRDGDVTTSDASAPKNNNGKNKAITLPSVSGKVEEATNVTSQPSMTSSTPDEIEIAETALSSGEASREKRAPLLRTVRAVVTAFTVAIVPSIAVMVAGLSPELEPRDSRFDPSAKAAWSSCAYLASRILFANSFVNAIIYNCVSPDFRTSAKRLLGRKKPLQSSTSAE